MGMGMVGEPDAGPQLRRPSHVAQPSPDNSGPHLARPRDRSQHGNLQPARRRDAALPPRKEPSQLVLLGKGRWNGISDAFPITELYSYPFYREMQRKNVVFSDVAATLSMTNSVHGLVEGRDETEPMNVQLVSGTYFPRSASRRSWVAP